MNRILNWFFGGDEQPAYYAEREYTPRNLWLHASVAPKGGDCEIDIRDDGVSIFANESQRRATSKAVNSEIQYGNQSGAFTVAETVTGGTSGATGTVVSDTRGDLRLSNESAASFSIDETITGGTSGSTATVNGYKRGGALQTVTLPETKTVAIVDEGSTLNNMGADFLVDGSPIDAGSVITCHRINFNGAHGISVQLELESLTDEDEELED